MPARLTFPPDVTRTDTNPGLQARGDPCGPVRISQHRPVRRPEPSTTRRPITSRLLWELGERARGQELVEPEDLAVQEPVG
jgi:hypothetical protein